MKKAAFCKFSNNRVPQYSIYTTIYRDGAKQWVEKTPATACAEPHVQKMQRSCGLLSEEYDGTKLAPCSCELKGNIACFDYITGDSLYHELIERVEQNDRQSLQDFIRKYIGLITDGEQIPYSKSREFTDFFGEISLPDGLCSMKHTNIDMLMENLIRTPEGKIWMIDYEWCFDFPIPVNYVLYRSLLITFENAKKQEVFVREVLPILGLGAREVSAYKKMEKALQKNIYGRAYPLEWQYDSLGKGAIDPMWEHQELQRIQTELDNAYKGWQDTQKLLQKTQQELDSAYAGWQETRRESQKGKAELEAAYAGWQETREKLQKTQTELETAYNGWKKEQETLASTQAELQNAYAGWQTEHAELNSLRTELQEVSTKWKKDQAELAASHQEAQELRDMLTRIQQSNAWKVLSAGRRFCDIFLQR